MKLIPYKNIDIDVYKKISIGRAISDRIHEAQQAKDGVRFKKLGQVVNKFA